MAESGGPTTQSGIYYQNSITALYLGQLLAPGPASSRVVISVRTEAPAHVDDSVVTFDDGGRDFIQAKESLPSGEDWKKLWRKLHDQSRGDFHFPKDRLALFIGETTGRANHIREMAKRAIGALTDREWLSALNGDQRDIVSSVEKALALGNTTDDVFQIFRRLNVTVRTIEDIEQEQVPLLLPETTKDQRELFRTLRDRVSGGARFRGIFTREELISALQEEDPAFQVQTASDMGSLRSAAYACGASLRANKVTMGPMGIHLPRKVTDELVVWLRSAESAGTISMLCDDAGRGKTVVMRDVLDELESTGTLVLGMKADIQLTGVEGSDDIQRSLQLPESLARVVTALAQCGPVVVLIDQVDALSHNLATDARTLNVVLDEAARLRIIPNVRLVVSCRRFDRETDPRLRRLTVDKEFKLDDLSEAEIQAILGTVGIEYQALTAATKALLRTPLHLDIFVWLKTRGGSPESDAPGALQDLYSSILRDVALQMESGAPTPSERERVLELMTEFMAAKQRTSVPVSHIREKLFEADRAISWLASHGIIVLNGVATFFHQTFFDYLYAKRFVEGGSSLVAHLASSPQSLRQRTELVQILMFARGANPSEYLRWLDALWTDTALRPHLRRLLARWFGALRVPTADEVAWARLRVGNAADRLRLLDSIRGNAAWLIALRPEIAEILRDPASNVVDAALSVLASAVNEAQREVVELLRPFLGAGEEWRNRLWWVVNSIREWNTPEAVDLFGSLIDVFTPPFAHFFEFRQIRTAYPAGFARIARTLLNHCDKRAEERNKPSFSYLSGAFDEFLQTDFDEALEELALNNPSVFLDALEPWMMDVLEKSSYKEGPPAFFRYDYFAAGWESSHGLHATIISSYVVALTAEAGSTPARFDLRLAALKKIPIGAAQWVVAAVYRKLPDRADEALEFLCADSRRLALGKGMEITMGLIRDVASSASSERQKELESLVLAYRGFRSAKSVQDLRLNGLEQYQLLSAFPARLLSRDGQRRLGELQRKFPTIETTPKKPGLILDDLSERSPIQLDRAKKMGDLHWLAAIAKHRDNKGMPNRSPRQFAETLRICAKEEPSRFSDILDRLPDSTSDIYVRELIESLGAPAGPLRESLLRAIRKFAPQAGRDLRRGIAWMVQRHPSDIPADILDVLETWVRNPFLDYGDDSTSLDYLNTDRGAAFLGLMSSLRAQDNPDSRSRRWKLFEFIADQHTLFLRAAAIEELRYELFEDTARALDLFDSLVIKESDVLAADYVDDFVRLALGRDATRMLPIVEKATASQNEKVRERAASLACLAAVAPSVLSAEALSRARFIVERIMGGNEASTRIAVTKVVAHNIDGPAGDYCIDRLTRALDDLDQDVRDAISGVFWKGKAVALIKRPVFLVDYASSPAIVSAQQMFGQFLVEHMSVDVRFGLELIERLLPQLAASPKPPFGDDLVRYVLRASGSPLATGELQQRAMDAFDKLDERFGPASAHLLSQWDRP